MTFTRPIRVLIVAPSLDMIGGQSVNAARLVQRLPEVERLAVSFLPVNPRLPGPLRALQRIKYVRTIATSIGYGWSLLRRVPSADVVHAFSASYWSFLLAPLPALLMARLFGKRTVLNYRSGEADDHLRRWATARWGVRRADAVIVPSGYLVDVFARHRLVARAIANFVDSPPLRFRARFAPDGVACPRFIANRHLEPMYNVPCVVRAFARIQQEFPEAKLLLVGDGSARAAVEGLVRELGCRNVTFTGKVRPEEMPELYDAADVYLNAPNIDNMPGSVIECFAAGLPVVSTEAGGIPYIVERGVTGFLLPTGDDEGLAASALRLLREPGLAHRIVEAGRREAESRYVWPAVRDQWTALYVELADGLNGGTPSEQGREHNALSVTSAT